MVLSPNIFKFQMVGGLPYTFGSHLSGLGAVVTMLAMAGLHQSFLTACGPFNSKPVIPYVMRI